MNQASVKNLQAIYGLPSQAGFGSAVFLQQVEPTDDLETVALQYYRYFMGNQWDESGEAVWMSSWKQVYLRQAGDRHDIVTELRSIKNSTVTSSVEMLLDSINDAQQGQKALSEVYDSADVKELAVYTLGDGAALSGLMIAGRNSTGEATFLVFLLD